MAIEDDDAWVEPQEGSASLEHPSGGSGDDDVPDEEPETFTAEYVKELRDEAAAHRVRAKRAEAAEDRLRVLAIEAAARGVLADPTDLPWSPEYEDNDGWPDAAKLTAAAQELATRKPHLTRPRGDVGQGRHSEDRDTVSLVGLLKQGA